MTARCRHALLCIATVAVALLLAACADSEAPGTAAEGDPVNEQQALVLARMLEQNWQRGGSEFSGSMTIHDVAVEIKGRVNFRSGRGTATLTDPTGEKRRYFWTRKAVYAQSAPGTNGYTTQRPNPDADPVHRMIAFLNLLSAETVDNTTNIIDQGARYLGPDTLDGVSVDRYRYGKSGLTTYWVSADDGLLHRVDAQFDGGPLSVTLNSHEPVKIALPDATGS